MPRNRLVYGLGLVDNDSAAVLDDVMFGKIVINAIETIERII